jgi:hypothetical protein
MRVRGTATGCGQKAMDKARVPGQKAGKRFEEMSK